MGEVLTLSIDAMGGDHGPQTILAGLDLVRLRKPHVHFLLFGDQQILERVLSSYRELGAISTIVHTDVAIDMTLKPSQALRKGRGVSSMWCAIEAVKEGRAQAAVSAGNTGALMAMSKFCLRMMADVQRPAIAALWPSLRGESIVLDVGATVGADADQLIDFAIMGAAMSRALYGTEHPSVGLLNVGVEEIKGNEAIKDAGARLKDVDLGFMDYQGFVEGNDIGKGRVDVVVTEGFSGNIALKTAEGTARQIASYLKSAMSRTLMAKIGYLFAKHAFDSLKDKMNPSKVNGGVFLGLNGLVIKSHGSADADGIASAVELAANMVENRLNDKISKDIATARDMIAF